MALSISAGNGGPTSQANTQTPQASVGPATQAESGGNVQPGTAANVLTSQQGVALNGNSQLSVVNLSLGDHTTTSQTQQAVKPAKHHASPVLLGVAGAIVLVAVVVAIVIARSSGKTTK
jgi:hypothetical protein